MRFALVLLCATLFLTPRAGWCGPFADEAACKKSAAGIVAGLEEGSIRKVVHAMQGRPEQMTDEEKLDLDRATEQVAAMRLKHVARYGEPLNRAELVRSERISDCYVRYTILEHFERNAMVWRVSYYKPRDSYQFHHVNLSDEINNLYEVVP